MAQPRAVIDIVRAEAGAHQLLKQIGLLVRAFGGTETGQRLGALLVADLDETFRGDIERLLPGSFAEVRKRLAGSTWSLESFFAFGNRTNGLVRRWG